MASTFLHAKTEPELAAYQKLQVGNSCTLHSISAAIKLLLDVDIDPQALSEEIDQLWWRFRPMRVFPGWAITPHNQKSIVNYLAETRGLPVAASFSHSTSDVLLSSLSEPGCVPLITLLWMPGKAPPIYLGYSMINRNADKNANAHTMVLAAYDPTHIITGIGPTPWGFINSWSNGGANIYWMRDEDFQNAWDFFLPTVGPRPLVLVEHTS